MIRTGGHQVPGRLERGSNKVAVDHAGEGDKVRDQPPPQPCRHRLFIDHRNATDRRVLGSTTELAIGPRRHELLVQDHAIRAKCARILTRPGVSPLQSDSIPRQWLLIWGSSEHRSVRMRSSMLLLCRSEALMPRFGCFRNQAGRPTPARMM